MGTKKQQQIDLDRDLIRSLGGATKVAGLLDFPKLGGVQRVQNWVYRGIPAAIKLAYPKLFLSGRE